MAEQSDTTNPSTLNDSEALRHIVDGADFLCNGGEAGVYLLVSVGRDVLDYLIELDSEGLEDDGDGEEEPDREMDLSDYEPTEDDLPVRGHPIRMYPNSGMLVVPEAQVLLNHESLIIPELK